MPAPARAGAAPASQGRSASAPSRSRSTSAAAGPSAGESCPSSSRRACCAANQRTRDLLGAPERYRHRAAAARARFEVRETSRSRGTGVGPAVRRLRVRPISCRAAQPLLGGRLPRAPGTLAKPGSLQSGLGRLEIAVTDPAALLSVQALPSFSSVAQAHRSQAAMSRAKPWSADSRSSGLNGIAASAPEPGVRACRRPRRRVNRRCRAGSSDIRRCKSA